MTPGHTLYVTLRKPQACRKIFNQGCGVRKLIRFWMSMDKFKLISKE